MLKKANPVPSFTVLFCLMVLNLLPAPELPGGIAGPYTRVSDSEDLGEGQKICLSNKISDDSAGLRTLL